MLGVIVQPSVEIVTFIQNCVTSPHCQTVAQYVPLAFYLFVPTDQRRVAEKSSWRRFRRYYAPIW